MLVKEYENMTELFSTNARFFEWDSIGKKFIESIVAWSKDKKRKLFNYCFGFFALWLPLLVFAFSGARFSAGFNLASTVDFYVFYQYVIGYMLNGLKFTFDLFQTIFTDVFLLFTSLVAIFFIAYTAVRKRKKEKKESDSFNVQKYIRERKISRYYSNRYFITFSRFLS